MGEGSFAGKLGNSRGEKSGEIVVQWRNSVRTCLKRHRYGWKCSVNSSRRLKTVFESRIATQIVERQFGEEIPDAILQTGRGDQLSDESV